MNYVPNVEEIKKLRQVTSCGPLACKEALLKTNGNQEEAIQYLREKYANSFSKRSENETNEGVFGICLEENATHGAVIELLCESASAAASEGFIILAKEVAKLLVYNKDFRDNIVQNKNDLLNSLKTVNQELYDLILKLRENIKLNKFEIFDLSKGPVYTYKHEVGANKVLAAVQVKNHIEDTFKLASHICYAEPVSLEVEKITKEMIHDRKVKKAEDLVLTTQRYFFNQKSTIQDLLKDNEVVTFVRFKVGE